MHHELRLTRLQRTQARRLRRRRADSAGPVPDGGLPGPLRRTDPAHAARPLVVRAPRQRRGEGLELGGVPRAPDETVTVDIHCVTRWSKLDTEWEGVSVDTILAEVDEDAPFLLAFCDGGYTTNLAVEDVTDGKAWVAFAYGGEPIDPEHGGPARLLVPHLYFWKSAKWVRGLQLRDEDEPGFWETNGYHLRGDPWQEQRYWGD